MLSQFFITGFFMFAVMAFPSPDGGNSVCANWCAANFPQPGQCTSQAAHGHGPCYDCGPQSTSPTNILCNGQCTDSLTDPDNCGTCGNVCASGTSCVDGQCTAPPPTCTPGNVTPGGNCHCTYAIECDEQGERRFSYPSGSLDDCILACDNDVNCLAGAVWEESTGNCWGAEFNAGGPTVGWVFATASGCNPDAACPR